MAKLGFHGKDKQQCGARLRGKFGFCKSWPLDGKTRCRLHGGLSTGAKSPEAREKIIAAMVEGRKRWLATQQQQKAEGKIKRLPMGRRSGAGWKTEAMHQREWAEMRAERLAKAEGDKPAKRRPGRPSKADVLARVVEQQHNPQPRPIPPGLDDFERDKQLAKIALQNLRARFAT